MSIGLLFWILYIIFFILGAFVTRTPDNGRFGFVGPLIGWVLIGLLGWAVFGPPIQ